MSLSAEEMGLLGGSDLAPILGLSPWRTPLQVYARIVHGATDGDNHAWLKRGRHLEGAVLSLYAETTGAVVLDSPKLKHPRFSFTRASLDALVQRNGRRVAEVKTAGYSEARHWGEDGSDAVPQGYVFQTQWYGGVAMACGAVDVGDVDVAALVAGDLRVYHVPFDPELFAMLEEAVERFWVDHVLPKKPPPLTEPFKDLQAVGAMYRKHDGDAVRWESLGPPEQVAVLEYLQARREEREAAERRALWESRAKLALRGAPQLLGLPADTLCKRIDWKQSKPSKVTDWQAVARGLASGTAMSGALDMLIQKHTTTKEGARPFAVRETRDE